MAGNFDLETELSNSYFIALSRYHSQRQRFRSVYPEIDRNLVLDFSELADPITLGRKCFRFLGGDPDFAPDVQRQNVTPTLKQRELAFTRSGLTSFGRFLPA